MSFELDAIESLDEGFTESPLGVHYQPDRIYIEQREPGNMACHHWHGHVEINLPFDDSVDYLLNGRRFTLPAGHLGVFWAAVPHRLIDRRRCRRMMVAYVPIQMFLLWPLEERLYNDLLHGAVLASRDPYPLPPDQLDLLIRDFHQWDDTLSTLVAEELLIMLRRVTWYGWQQVLEPTLREQQPIRRGDPSLDQVRKMLDYIAKHYDEPITTASIAGQVGLHPNYAIGQFKKVMRTSIKQYINRMRVNHAKALLADTRRPILDIALSVGFSANSRFYVAFKRFEGMTPLQYRRLAYEGGRREIPQGEQRDPSRG